MLNLVYRSLPVSAILDYRSANVLNSDTGRYELRYPTPSPSDLEGIYFVFFVDVDSAIHFRNNYPDYWDNALRFAIVRNCYQKMLSSWFYCPTTRSRTLEVALSNPPAGGHDYIHFTLPQTSFVAHEGKLLPEYIIRMENLWLELGSLLEESELPILISDMKPVNVTSGKPIDADKFLTSEVVSLINEKYHADFELLGYNKLDS